MKFRIMDNDKVVGYLESVPEYDDYFEYQNAVILFRYISRNGEDLEFDILGIDVDKHKEG